MEQKIRKHFCSDMDLMVFVDEAVKKAECNAFFNAVYDNLYKREKGGNYG